MVRKESGDTQLHESCQQINVAVDRDEGMEELSFTPSAVSESAGLHEPSRSQQQDGPLSVGGAAT